MSAAELGLYLGMTLIGLGLSAFFSGLETGLYTVNPVRLTVRAKRGERAAMRLQNELARPNRVLATLLVGNNIANYLGTYGLAAILAAQGLSETQSLVVNAAVLIPLLFVFGETLPKDLFQNHTDSWSYRCAGVLGVVRRLLTWTGLTPLVQGAGSLLVRAFGDAGGNAITPRQRVAALMREGLNAGVLTESQTTLVDRGLAMRSRTVAAEMAPWSKVYWISTETPIEERQRRFRHRDFSRVPVVAPGGRVVGVITLLDAALAPEAPTTTLMQTPFIIPPETTVSDALRQLRVNRRPMAIVQARGSKFPTGLVTMKDLIEPLTGDLADW